MAQLAHLKKGRKPRKQAPMYGASWDAERVKGRLVALFPARPGIAIWGSVVTLR